MSERGPRLVLDRYNWERESASWSGSTTSCSPEKARRSASSVETGGSQPSTDLARDES